MNQLPIVGEALQPKELGKILINPDNTLTFAPSPAGSTVPLKQMVGIMLQLTNAMVQAITESAVVLPPGGG